ncbi:putative lipoprotein LpqT [Mycobacterium marinum]|nr:putative lipoprotein LpqT [Mycobacterium marinum]GJO09410.1 putative lipoprotein LpqT [Mycobacterium marinum]GJO12330.1 putative lipoprotein LpqT [Mycobacterium marinum]GJO13201.1 putative lipoprotein LpqT [Mycobacterium marinum]GJO17768.1 putative lipoprotein LpqT [Mycobacterium marinum]
MTARRIAAAVVSLAVTMPAVACSTPEPPDYKSIWTTSATTSTTATTAPPVPLSQYLESIGVSGKQIAPSDLKGLTVSIPTPAGWSPYEGPKINPETVIISKGGHYPTARLVVFLLRGNFDPADVARRGNDDAQLFENFKQLDASSADFHGFPSSMMQGSYDLEGARMHSWNRIVIPTGPPPDNQRYLVQLTITSLASQAAGSASDIESIINGFVVAVK